MKKTITLLAVCLLLMSVLAGFTAFFNRTEEVGYFTALKVTIRSNAINVYSIIRLSKKSSLCWAFSIIYAIIIPGDAKCWNVEKWNEEYTKSWTPRA